MGFVNSDIIVSPLFDLSASIIASVKSIEMEL